MERGEWSAAVPGGHSQSAQHHFERVCYVMR